MIILTKLSNSIRFDHSQCPLGNQNENEHEIGYSKSLHSKKYLCITTNHTEKLCTLTPPTFGTGFPRVAQPFETASVVYGGITVQRTMCVLYWCIHHIAISKSSSKTVVGDDKWSNSRRVKIHSVDTERPEWVSSASGGAVKCISHPGGNQYAKSSRGPIS